MAKAIGTNATKLPLIAKAIDTNATKLPLVAKVMGTKATNPLRTVKCDAVVFSEGGKERIGKAILLRLQSK